MEETRKYTPAAEHMLKYSPLLLAIFAVVVVGVLAVSIGTAHAAQPAVPAANVPDYAAMYQEALNRIAELEQACAAKDALYNTAAGQLTEQETRIAELTEALAASQEELNAFIAKFATTYVVYYEIRHSNVLCPEAMAHFSRIVSAETYKSLRIGDVLPATSEHLSIPNSAAFSEWTAIVVDKQPVNTWEQNT